MEATEPPQRKIYYVMKGSEILGPFTVEELEAGVSRSEFTADDFAQLDGYPIWQPIGRILGGATDDLQGAMAPAWDVILTWAWRRVRYHFDEQSEIAGVVFLVIGTLALALSRWPFVFWLPWFLVAMAAAFLLLKRQRNLHGALLLGASILVPLLLIMFGPKPAAPEAGKVSDVSDAVPYQAPEPPKAAKNASSAASPTTPIPVAVAQPTRPIQTAPPPLEKPAPPQPPTLLPANSPPAPSVSNQTQNTAAAATPEPSRGIASKVANFFDQITGTPPPPAVAVGPASSTALAGPGQVASAQVQYHPDAFAVVKGDEGSGSSFVCLLDGKPWLFTNIHVTAELHNPKFTRLDGGPLSLGAADAAQGHDIMRIALNAAPPHPLEAITDFNNNVALGDEVVVLGNSGGGGVVTSLTGTVLGVGPDRIEVSAEFIPGNSGSPIIHKKTGKVIGVATYLTRRYDEFAKGDPKAPVVRRFAYRLDSVKTWEPVNWGEFRSEAEQIRQISLLTGDVFDFLHALQKKGRPSFATATLRTPAEEWMSTIQSKHISEADIYSATESFLHALSAMVRGDVTTAESRVRYDYFRTELHDEREVRDALCKAFDEEAKRMESPSGRAGS